MRKRLHASVGKVLRDAWDLDSADRAARVLERLAGSLERDLSRRTARVRVLEPVGRVSLEPDQPVRRVGPGGSWETLTVQASGLTGGPLARTGRRDGLPVELNERGDGAVD